MIKKPRKQMQENRCMKIFVISLKDSKDRRKKIESQMKKLKLNFEFFDAIDGRKVLPKKYESMVDRKLAQRRLGKEISDGEIACSLSHALVYKKIIAEKIKNAIILEDDCIFGDDFAEMVKNKLCENSGKDFIYLYHLYARAMYGSKNKFFKQYNMVKLAKTPNGAVGYYLTLETVQKILEQALPISYVSDWGVNINNITNTVAITPRIVTHPKIDNSNLEILRTGNKNSVGQFGICSLLCYKFKKIFSYKISKTITKIWCENRN